MALPNVNWTIVSLKMVTVRIRNAKKCSYEWQEFLYAINAFALQMLLTLNYKCDEAFKIGPSKICGRQPLKNLKG